ncbi:M23 family metallopeptidase [Antribacter sp. KLBMP9083]|uniref:M23 family metallopeptidase n=1 Tax=Antribacter soli TaxID=2910976 RepID=A0AA41QJ50_9MICO|nr:M23 family metallopeptidase [Antribacter soli]MCF4123680.1 M23 family metallopeptidase [Antribacter soli]
MHKLPPFVVFPVLLLGPSLALLVVTVFASASTSTPCGPVVTAVPGEVTATTTSGASVRLDGVQLGHAVTIVRVGGATEGVGRDGIVVALMAALAESRLRMLANATAYPESAGFANDGDGSDHDSLGLFQMRPAAGWGSVAELMDADYQAQAFFGGPDGPNGGSPRGLLDIPGWQSVPKGVAAQSVEVSAHSDRYAEFGPVAEAILASLTAPGPGEATIGPSGSSEMVEAAADTPAASTTFVVFPLPEGTWRWTSGYGPRIHPVHGTATFHAGVDYVAPAGTPVLAVADGVVSDVSANQRSGNLVVIDHRLNGQAVATAYAHLLGGSVLVREGDPVTAGQQIAAVGSTGAATGPHLHFEVHPGGFYAPVDPEPWLAAHAAGQLKKAAPAACTTGGER